MNQKKLKIEIFSTEKVVQTKKINRSKSNSAAFEEKKN